MKKKLAWIFAVILLGLVAFALYLWSIGFTIGNDYKPPAMPVVNKISEHEIQVIGLITEPYSVGHVIAHLTPQINKIRLSSYGGPIDDAMDLADVILDRKIAIEIDGLCMSSCANYLFPAGREKSVLPNSLVCAHGSAITDKRWLLKLFQYKNVERERQLFKRMGMSPEILGDDFHPEGEYDFYCPTLKEWELAGLKNILQFWYPKNQVEMNQVAKDFVRLYDPERYKSGRPIPVEQGRFD